MAIRPLAESLDPLDARRRALEERDLRAALRATRGNRSAAAKALAVPPPRLYRMLARHPDVAREFPSNGPGPQPIRR